jgi:threonine/homoserine/homoserine lactone efflux protein
MLGITFGFGPMAFLVGIGIGRVLDAAPAAYQTMKVASVLYMLWLAWKIATAGPVRVEAGGKEGTPLTFLQAAGFQWLNPKAWTMCLTAVSAYTVPDQFLLGVIIVTATFVAVSMPAISVWTAFGMSLRNWLSNRRRRELFNVAMALALIASLWPTVVDIWRFAA